MPVLNLVTYVRNEIALPTPAWLAEIQQFFFRQNVSFTQNRKRLYNALTQTLVQAGIWPKLDALYIFATLDGDSAVKDLPMTDFDASLASSDGTQYPVFRPDIGYRCGFLGGGGAGNLDTHHNPQLGNTRFTLNDASAFYWVYDRADLENDMGLLDHSFRCFFGSSAVTGANVRLNGAPSVTSAATGNGFYAVDRASATQIRMFKDGVEDANSPAAQNSDLVCSEMTVGGNDSQGWVGDQTYCAAGFGASLTGAQHLTLYNALHTYLQAVGAVV